jgi:hypothetical protein
MAPPPSAGMPGILDGEELGFWRRGTAGRIWGGVVWGRKDFRSSKSKDPEMFKENTIRPVWIEEYFEFFQSEKFLWKPLDETNSIAKI